MLSLYYYSIKSFLNVGGLFLQQYFFAVLLRIAAKFILLIFKHLSFICSKLYLLSFTKHGCVFY